MTYHLYLIFLDIPALGTLSCLWGGSQCEADNLEGTPKKKKKKNLGRALMLSFGMWMQGEGRAFCAGGDVAAVVQDINKG